MKTIYYAILLCLPAVAGNNLSLFNFNPPQHITALELLKKDGITIKLQPRTLHDIPVLECLYDFESRTSGQLLNPRKKVFYIPATTKVDVFKCIGNYETAFVVCQALKQARESTNK